jgi:protein-tyrosine phosphatase
MARHILFICTGNVCRSPLAELAARKQFGHLGLDFASAGLQAPPGLPVSAYSAQVAATWGGGLDGHASRQLTPELAACADWLIGMTRSHAAIMRSRFADLGAGAIGWLGAPGLDVRHQRFTPDGPDVDDPYGGDLVLYETTGKKIWDLVSDWTEVFAGLATSKGEGP